MQIVLHVEPDALRAESETGQAVLDGGVRVSAETSRRLACDASLVVMRHDATGAVLDVGRRTRTIPAAIRRALEHRDRGCRFPGCTNRLVDAHHVDHWADGGTTCLDNLVLLCRRHHRLVHEDGYRVTSDATGDFAFVQPDGRVVPAVPTLPIVSARRPTILPSEARPELGFRPSDRMDLGWVLRVLYRPRESGTGLAS